MYQFPCVYIHSQINPSYLGKNEKILIENCYKYALQTLMNNLKIWCKNVMKQSSSFVIKFEIKMIKLDTF